MLKLEVTKRDGGPKAKALRADGRVPGVFYGPKTENTPISIAANELEKVWREAGETSVVTLLVEGKEVDVLVHDLTNDPVTGKPIHVDFYAIDKTKKVEVDIPVEFVGVSPAVKELGGTLVKVMHEIPVEGLPGNLPQHIEVDISALTDLESTISVSDLKLPEGVTALAEADEVVASIATQKEEEEAPVEADLSSIEVEKKGKQEEEAPAGEAQ